MSDLPMLLERFRRGPELLAVLLTGVFGEEEDYSIAPGKWSTRQIVAHLADTELVYAYRLRQVLTEDNPTLVNFDQDAWALGLDYAHRKPKQSLESFRRLRAENYEILKDLPPAAFERMATHNKRGPMNLLGMLEGWANHTESHARQVQTIRDAYKQAKGKK